MKLCPVEVVKQKYQPFEKTALEDFCVILHIFLSNRVSKLARLPKFIHGNKLHTLAYVEI